MSEIKSLRDALDAMRAMYPGEYVTVSAAMTYYESSSKEKMEFRVYRDMRRASTEMGEQGMGPTIEAAMFALAEKCRIVKGDQDVTADGEIVAHDAPGVPQEVPGGCEDCGGTNGMHTSADCYLI